MRHLVNEQRPCIDIFNIVYFHPFKSACPLLITYRIYRVSGRTKRKNIKYNSLAIPHVPTVSKKTRFGLPAMRYCFTTI